MKDYVSKLDEEMISTAEKLGYDELIFVGNIDLPKFKTRIKLSCSKRIFKSSSKDRNLIESRKVDVLYDFEQLNKKDGMNFLSSGLNHVIAKLMKDKNVAYGLSFSQLLSASREERARILGRMMQNLKLCKKYKVKVVIGSFASCPGQMRDFKDLMAFARTLGLEGYKP